MLVLAISCSPIGWAQQPAGNGASPAATGQDASALGTAENPPLSGLDQPSLEPGATAHNILQPAVQASQSVDSNIGNELGNSAVHGVTRVLGSLVLERLWERYQTGLAYIGGGALYPGYVRTGSLIQAFEAQQRIGWRTGQFVVRDTFSYLPEGEFGAGGAYGLSGLGGGFLGGGIPGFSNSQQLGTLGTEPRITNLVLGEVVESLTPRSAITAMAGYGLLHFFDNSSGFVDGNTITAEAGYNYQLTRKDLVAVVYGYQGFRYPNPSGSLAGTSINNNIVSLMYGRRISGRMNFSVSAGPQITQVHIPGQASSDRLNAYAHVLLGYRFTRTSLSLTYSHRNTNGSGFSLGAESDIARISASRPFSRLWEASTDAGFSRNKSIVPVEVNQAGQVIEAHVYDYLFAGVGVRRRFGRYFTGFLNYQFNDLTFDSEACSKGPCNSQRHVAILGLQWHPRPVRLD